MIRHFILFLKSFFSPEPYAAAIQGRLVFGWFLLNQLILAWVGILVAAAIGYCMIIPYILPGLLQFPNLQIENGQIITKLPKPVFFPAPDPKKPAEKAFMLIDPSLTVKDIVAKKPDSAKAYLVKDGLVTTKKNETRIFTFKDMKFGTRDMKSFLINSDLIRVIFRYVFLMLVIISPLILFMCLPAVLICLYAQIFYCLGLAVLMGFLFGEKPRAAKIFTLAWVMLIPAILWQMVLQHFIFVSQPLFFTGIGLLILVGLKYSFRHKAPADSEITVE